MRGKSLFLTCVLVVLSCAHARAQDANRVPDTETDIKAVDGSVHAAIGTEAEPAPLQQPVERSVSSSSQWGIRSGGQPALTQFWPARSKSSDNNEGRAEVKNQKIPSKLGGASFTAGSRTAKASESPDAGSTSTVTSASGNYSGGVDRRLSHLGNPSVGRTPGDSTAARPFNATVPPLQLQPQVDGFSTPFRKRQVETSSATSAFGSPFGKATAPLTWGHTKAKPSKGHPMVSTDHSRWSP